MIFAIFYDFVFIHQRAQGNAQYRLTELYETLALTARSEYEVSKFKTGRVERTFIRLAKVTLLGPIRAMAS